MRVIVYAEDLSGRRDDGYYSKSDLGSALDLFFGSTDDRYFADPDGEEALSRTEIEGIFSVDRRVTFYNGDGEKTVIAADLGT